MLPGRAPVEEAAACTCLEQEMSESSAGDGWAGREATEVARRDLL